jgi:hypothetical protein
MHQTKHASLRRVIPQGPTGVAVTAKLLGLLVTAGVLVLAFASSDCGFRTPLDDAAPPDTRPRRVPQRHRIQAAPCPPQRAAGLFSCRCPTANGASCICQGDECGSDTDCRAKRNGRCIINDPYAPSTATCSYDDCLSDSDCASRVPCECRESAASFLPNACLVGSDCQIDADCGANGFCSPSQFGQWCGPTYHCHRPSDSCIDDSDCNSAGCNFDAQAGHWSCGGDCGPHP